MKRTHVLKCHPEPFAAILRGDKRCEFRYNDRDFKTGDVLRLREYVSDRGFTAHEYVCEVTHVQTGFGIPSGFVMMSIKGVI